MGNQNNDDLGEQNPDGSDNIQKSENPDKSYMEEKGLCKKCHALINDHGQCTKGCS